MINLCKLGQNPSIHLGDRVQTRGYINADKDANRIHTKNNMFAPMVGGGGGGGKGGGGEQHNYLILTFQHS